VTHNRFFERPQDLCDALFHKFDYVRHHPQEIERSKTCSIPFFDPDVELFMRVYIAHRIPGLKVGKRWRFRASALNRWLEDGINSNTTNHAALTGKG
jgi:hypothetical protein